MGADAPSLGPSKMALGGVAQQPHRLRERSSPTPRFEELGPSARAKVGFAHLLASTHRKGSTSATLHGLIVQRRKSRQNT